ncbi:MAG: hypothetical protein ACRDBX_00530 [Erysipelotrichaceae bacterium]
MKPFNKKGSVLPMTVMLISVISILGAALLSVSLVNQKMAIQENDSEQAYLSAKSVSQYIEQNISTLYKANQGVNFTIPSGSASGVLGDVIVSSNAPTEVDGNILNISVEATYEGKKAKVNSAYKLNVIPVFTSMINISNQLHIGTGTYPGAGFTDYNETDFEKLTQEELKEIIQSIDGTQSGFNPIFKDPNLNIITPTIANKKCVSYSAPSTNTAYINVLNNTSGTSTCDITSDFFKPANRDRNVNIQASAEGTNVTIAATDQTLMTSPEKTYINVVIDPNTTIKKQVVNIYVKSVNGGNNVTLPTIRYYVRDNTVKDGYRLTTRPSDPNTLVVEVNVYCDEANFTINLHQNQDNGGKQDGVIDANIMIPNGTLTLTTDDKTQQVDWTKSIIIGTVVCKDLVVDRDYRGDNPYFIDQTGWTRPEDGKKVVKVLFDRYQK